MTYLSPFSWSLFGHLSSPRFFSSSMPKMNALSISTEFSFIIVAYFVICAITFPACSKDILVNHVLYINSYLASCKMTVKKFHKVSHFGFVIFCEEWYNYRCNL